MHGFQKKLPAQAMDLASANQRVLVTFKQDVTNQHLRIGQ